MSVLDKLTAVVTGETEYELLAKRLENLRREREHLAQKAEEEIRAYAAALVEGQPTGVLDPGIERRLRALDEAIAEIQRRMKAAEPDHIRAEIARTQAEIDRIDAELAPFRRAVEEARKKLEEAEGAYNRANGERAGRWEHLHNKLYQLRHRLAVLEEQQRPPVPAEPDPARVEALLADYRAGRRHVTDHNDPSDVLAAARYRQERDALQHWAVQLEAAGVDADPPEEVRSWPPGRAEELLRAMGYKKAASRLRQFLRTA